MYKLQDQSIKRLSDGASIPMANGNRDYEEYKQWLAEGNIPEPEFSTSELEAIANEQAIQEWKYNRQTAVDNIEVVHNDITYQGDEIAQGRMARAIVAMDDVMTIPWVAKDNTIHLLTKTDLVAILGTAGVIQANLWTQGRP